MSRLFLGPGACALLLMVFGACGGGGGHGGGGGAGGRGGAGGASVVVVEQTNPSFQLTVESVDVVAPRGADKPLRVAITRAAGFADAVAVSLSATPGLEAGSVIISGSMSGGWLVLSLAADAAVGGPTTLVVTATSGALTATKALRLTVGAAQPSSQAMIAAARAAGTLDLGTALLYRAYASFGDGRLPPAYAGSGPTPEDNGLLADIRAALPALPAAMQAQLVPFTLRPSDPASWYNLDVAAMPAPLLAAKPARTAALFAAAPSPASCAASVAGATWASVRSASFPVRAWVPCGGDPIYDGQSMQMLAETLAVADKVWQPLGELMGNALGNPILDQDGADDAIDIYIDRGSGVARAGAVQSAGSLGGRAFPDAPLVGTTSSAFVVIPELQFGTPRFHPTIAHELFHVFQMAYSNAIANGAGTVDPATKYWFYEASATWAGAYFDRVLAPWTEPRGAYLVAYGRFKARFQVSHTSLNGDTEELHDYAAFIWPYFLEQSTGGPEIVGQIWKNLAGATSAAAADDIVDAAFPFATHFRDFALRNLNVGLLPGDPLPAAKRYIALDPDFKDDGVEPPYRDTAPTNVTFDLVDDLVEEEFAVSLNPLAARYLRFPVTNKNVKHVSFDLSDLSRWSGLDAAALVKINGAWEAAPRDVKSTPKLEFCRDKPEENVEEVRFIFGNHDRHLGQLIASAVGVTATITRCMGTWSGTSSFENKPVLQSGGTPVPDPTGLVTKCVANVTWVFDPDKSNAYAEHYHPEGTVTYSMVDTLGTKYEFNPSVHSIVDDANNGMLIAPDPSGMGFEVSIVGSTTFPSTETVTYAGGKPLTSQTSVSCLWFGGNGASTVKLGQNDKTIAGGIDTAFELGSFSFSK